MKKFIFPLAIATAGCLVVSMAWCQLSAPAPVGAGTDPALAPAAGDVSSPRTKPEAPPATVPEGAVQTGQPDETPAVESPSAESPSQPASEEEQGVVRIPMTSQEESQQIKDEKVTLSLNDVPLSEVVNLFMRLSGANIVASPTQLTGRVSVNLKEVDWKTALSQILSMHNLELNESAPDSGLYSISPPRAAAAVPLFAKTFELKYARAESITNALARLIAPNGSVLHGSGKNVSILATQAQIEKASELVDSLDHMIPQVAIEAKFVELNEEAIRNLGLNWSALKNYSVRLETPSRTIHELEYSGRNTTDFSDSTGDSPALMTPLPVSSSASSDVSTYNRNEGTAIIDNSSSSLTRTKTDTTNRNVIDQSLKSIFTSTVLSADTFALTLSALQENSGVEVVTNPKVVVSSGEQAKIHIGQRRPNIIKRTTSTTGGTTDVSYEYGTPEWIEIGTKVGVLPVVNTSSNITVKIEPELNRQVGLIEPQPGLTFPILVTRRVDSEFVIKSGETVAIGGLTSTEDRDVVKKIPLLGDIPLIGRYLFSHQNREKVQDETIIFVTVSIAEPDKMDSQTGVPSHASLVYEKHWVPKKGQIELRNNRKDDFLKKAEEAANHPESSKDIPVKPRTASH